MTTDNVCDNDWLKFDLLVCEMAAMMRTIHSLHATRQPEARAQIVDLLSDAHAQVEGLRMHMVDCTYVDVL